MVDEVFAVVCRTRTHPAIKDTLPLQCSRVTSIVCLQANSEGGAYVVVSTKAASKVQVQENGAIWQYETGGSVPFSTFLMRYLFSSRVYEMWHSFLVFAVLRSTAHQFIFELSE